MIEKNRQGLTKISQFGFEISSNRYAYSTEQLEKLKQEREKEKDFSTPKPAQELDKNKYPWVRSHKNNLQVPKKPVLIPKPKEHTVKSQEDAYPNFSIANTFAALSRKNTNSVFGNVNNPCSLQFGSVSFKFETEEHAQAALITFTKNSIETAITTFNGEYFINIPACDTKKFIMEVLGYSEKAYFKMVRDVDTLQRAQQAGNIDSIKVGKGHTEVSADTKEWVENGPCSIEFGDAIPMSILLKALNTHLNKKNKMTDYKGFQKWTPNNLNKDLTVLPVLDKGSYSPKKEGWLATAQAANLIYEVLTDYDEVLKNHKIVLETCQKRLGEYKELQEEYKEILEKYKESLEEYKKILKAKKQRQEESQEEYQELLKEYKASKEKYTVILKESQESQERYKNTLNEYKKILKTPEDKVVENYLETNKLLKISKIELLKKITPAGVKPSDNLSDRVMKLVISIDKLPSIDKTSEIDKETMENAAKALTPETINELEKIPQQGWFKAETRGLLHTAKGLNKIEEPVANRERKQVLGTWSSSSFVARADEGMRK